MPVQETQDYQINRFRYYVCDKHNQDYTSTI